MDVLTTRIAKAVRYVARSERRFPVFFRAVLAVDGGQMLRISIKNVSRSGFMGDCSDRVPAGSRVRLYVPFGASVEAEVRWVVGNRIGCRAARPLSLGKAAWVIAMAAHAVMINEIRLIALVVATVSATLYTSALL